MSCVLGKYFYHTTHIQENAQVSRVFPRTAPAPRPSRERCPNRRCPSCPLRLAARLWAAAVFISDAVTIFPPRTPGAGGRAARAASASEGRAAEVAVATAHRSVVCVQAAAFPTRCPWASEGFAGVRCARRDDANVLACGSWWTQVPVVCAGAWACEPCNVHGVQSGLISSTRGVGCPKSWLTRGIVLFFPAPLVGVSCVSSWFDLHFADH